jgi:hypothetical protein
VRELPGDGVDHVGVRQPLAWVEVEEAAGVRDRLEEDARHGRVLDPEADDVADLVVVDAALDGGRQRDAHARPRAAIERAKLLVLQPPAADGQVGRVPEAVELQIHMHADVRQCRGEARVARQPDAVGVQHHELDAVRLGGRQHVEDLWVDRRLAARELDRLGFALRLDEGVEHRLDPLEVQRVAVRLVPRAGLGEADRAVKIAGGVDLDDPETAVLLVLGADAAVPRTAVDDLGLQPQRAVARLVVALDLDVALRVAVHERLERAVVGAALAEVDPAIAGHYLRLDVPAADRADRAGQLEEGRVV